MAKKMIVKIQLDVPHKQTVLVYNEDKSLMVQDDMCQSIIDAFDSDGDEFKRYFYAWIDKKGRLVIGKEVKDGKKCNF